MPPRARSRPRARASGSIALNRAEFRTALDPASEDRNAAHKSADEMLAQIRELMSSVGKTTDGKVLAMLPGVQQSLSAYERTLKDTMAIADAASSQKVTESAAKLRDAVLKSQVAAEKLSSDVKAVAERLDERVQEFAQKTADEYVSTSRSLVGVSLASVLAGLLVGFLIGQYGIARPIRSIVALLQQLAAGNYELDIHSSDRKDEVGEVARTALAFKETASPSCAWKQKQRKPRRAPPHNARPIWSSLPTASRPPWARSSRPCRRPRPSSRHLPTP